MIRVKYERYWNDLVRKTEERTFTNLDALADWIFGQMQQDYTQDFVMSFPTPKKVELIGEIDPYRIEFKPTRYGETIWIDLIENINGIIFSDGRFTSGQKHWSPQVKKWCIACDKRQHAPKFNFVDDKQPTTEKWYAVTRWHVEDVIAAAKQQGVVLTEEQAAKWWREHEKAFAERLTQEGNEMLASENFKEVEK